MKQYIYVILALGFFFLYSCADETFVKNTKVEEGIPVEVSLAFTREDVPEVTTRAALPETEENKVYDVRVFIFDKDKKLEYTGIVEYEEGNTAKKGIISNCEVTSGQKYIYAIANTEGGAGNFSKTLGTDIKKVNDLKTLVSELNTETDQRLGGHLLMSGAYVEKNADVLAEEASCLVSKDMSGKSLAGEIKLTHVDSRVTFKVGVQEDSKITFVPRTWKVVNIPKYTNVFSAIFDYASISYFNTSEKSFDNSTIVDTKYKGGSFSFYMYENRKTAIKTPADYNDRERQDKNDTGLNGDFTYADPYATYVVLTGDYSDGDKTSAEVRYTIHLGYVNDIASDFSSLRNTIYTYKVTVVGVKNIILEVESSQPGEEFEEKQPGAEGSVVVAEQSISVDAHYEAKNVTFRKNDLTNLSVIVSTPYTLGEEKYLINATTGVVTSTMKNDYKWVKFVKRTAGSGLAKYPGNNKTVSVNGEGVPTNDDGKHYLTIDQVLQQLYNKKDDDGSSYWKGKNDDKSVTYTAFIDEYYYEEGDKNWKEFVNVEDRKMHILCNTKFSQDKQSNLTTANIMISQRSIKTIYNKSADGYSTAWGIETVDETKGMPMENSGTRASKNGRYNTFQMLDFSKEEDNGGWENYLDWTTESLNKLKGSWKSKRYAEYACLQRNRDLDGNGKIDADEIRWYLPSTTQYTGLWLGKDALYPEARLFQKDPEKITNDGTDGGTDEDFRTNNHFISSNGVRFWAEEGAATGNTLYNVKNSKFNYRCARNLGGYYTGVPKENESVDDYVQATLDNNGIVTKIVLTRVDPLALRSTLETSITAAPEHTGADLNRPYTKFEVTTAVKGKCPAGYRKPNQRELSLIAGYSTSSIGNTASCTYSDLTYKEDVYYTAFWKSEDKSNIVSLNGSSSSSVTRCVKDVD